MLAASPSILVADEPTTLLDLANAREVARVVAGLDEQVVLVTHHLDLVTGFDRVLVFDGGTVVHDGAPADAVAHYVALMA